MTRISLVVFLAASVVLAADTASAQRFPFEKTFQVTGSSALDITTEKGKIDVVAGQPDRIVVTGTVSIRIGLDVPANALALAQKVAKQPPVEQMGETIRIALPADDAERRAVTISYVVRVPPSTMVHSVSESGATTVRGVAGAVDVRTQSGAIAVANLGAAATVSTGSGAVTVDGVKGALAVTTQSSSVTGSALQGDVTLRTGSGAIEAGLTGTGNVDVKTQSSAIRVAGAKAGATLQSGSGRIILAGSPKSGEWNVVTGSSSIEITMDKGTACRLEATSGSSSVTVTGATVSGSSSKKNVVGTIAGGGPMVRLTSRSGSIRVAVASQGHNATD